MTTFIALISFAAGYAASVTSWPWIRTQATGISAEAADLRQRAAVLEARLRGL
jgi:hypothetical protein